MNFFENQDRARQNTQQLFGLFALSILVMILAIYIASLFFLRIAPRIWWHPGLFLSVAIVTTSAIAFFSLYKIWRLRQGGSIIATELGGILLLHETANQQERQLLNIVEEMAIASGISVPPVYLLKREPSINAFAAGFTSNNAVIGVTRGSLEQLNRDELQGVIAHEFSHILNGDMGLNLRLMGLLHGILFIYLTGQLLLRLGCYLPDNDDNDREDRPKGIPLWAFGLIVMVIGSIGFVCGRLIKAAVSRQREFLADAAAVQFTRNPDGISGALQKLQNMDSRLLTPRAEAASHMFFGNALKINFWEDMFATHPPLCDRIRRIGGVKLENIQPSSRSSVHSPSPDSLTMGFAGGGSQAETFTTPAQVVAQVGSVAPEHFAHAQALLAQLPESLRLGVREAPSAMAILLALALDTQNSQVQEKQLAWLRQVQPAELVEQALTLNSEFTHLDASIRLPLIDLTVPALRQTSARDCQRLCKCIQGLVTAKGKLSIGDFVLQLILWHRLQPCIDPTASVTVQFNSIEQIWSDCLLVLSALADLGETSAASVNYAFRSGVFRLPGATKHEKPETPVKCNLADVKKSLERLRLASPKLKQAVVDACAHTVLVDNKVTSSEGDLLRAIAMTLDCPIPPFLNSQRRTSKSK